MNTSEPPSRRWVRTMLAHHDGRHGIHQDLGRAYAVYQTSTMAALLDGIYDGDVTIGELLRHGDFGVGTFNHLDGEMLVLDGVCHHLRADGTATIADDADLTPFAAVTWFTPDATIPVATAHDRAAITALIDRSLDGGNLIVAVRIAATFSEVRTRTVAAQRPPYPPLTEAARHQQETTLRQVSGTLAGFRTPDYEQGLSVAGYHLHFIDDAGRHGGHALDYRIDHGQIQLGIRSELHLSLPRTPAFLHADLVQDDVAGQVREAEGS